jgi:hypothetical protein
MVQDLALVHPGRKLGVRDDNSASDASIHASAGTLPFAISLSLGAVTRLMRSSP